MNNELDKTQYSVIQLNSTTSQSHSSTLAIGMILDGKYEIIKEIARSRMGIVYEAYHKIFERKVAIKLIFSDKIDSLQFKRFKKEIKARAKLSHPNIVHIYNIGIYEKNPYIVMDYIDGVNICVYVSLHDKNYIKQKEHNAELGIQRDWKLCAKLIYKIALALEYIHKQKMFPINITPSNIIVRSDGTPIIIDLGLVKFQSEKVECLSRSGELLGSLQYMPIEQVQGKQDEIDARSDIYSLGLILYELLTGEMAYSGANAMEICYNIMSYYPPLPRKINPQIPEALEKITIHATEKQKEKRYATAQEFADALKKYLYGENAQLTKKNNASKKRVGLQWNKKYIALCCIVLIIGIMLNISMSNANKKLAIELEIKNLQEDYNKIQEKDLKELNKSLENNNNKLNKLNKEIETKKKELSDYKKECNLVQKDITNVTQIIKSRQKELTSVTQELQNIQTEKDTLKKDKRQSQSTINDLSKEIDSLKKERQRLNPRNIWNFPGSPFFLKTSNIEDNINYIEDAITDIENEIKDNEDKINIAKKSQDQEEEKLNSIQAKRQTLNDAIESIQYNKKVVTQQIEDLDRQIEDSESRIRELEREIEKLDREIEELDNKINSRKYNNNSQNPNNDYSNLNAKATLLNTKAMITSSMEQIRNSKQPFLNSKIEWENKLNQYQNEENTKQNELREVDNQISNLHSDINRTSRRIQQLKYENQDLKTKIQDLERRKTQLKTIEKKLEKLNVRKEEEKKEKDNLKNQLDKVIDRFSNKKDKAISLDQEITEEETKAKQLNNRLSNLVNQKEKYNLQEQEIQKEENYAKQLKNTLDELQQKIKKKETEAQQLQDKVNELQQEIKK